ncbi:MAG: phytoene desaturase family protein, partial [Gammaproteobacteria bacterium]
VLERRDIVGGGAITEELQPGFRCPTLAHAGGLPSSELVRELGLAKHGLEAIQPEVRVFALSPTGPAITLYQDPARTTLELQRISSKDAARYPEFTESFARIGRFLRPVLALSPPSVERPSLPESWQLLRLAKGFRDLGRKEGYRLLRWGPMAVADLAGEWFETDLLRAVVAARGIHGSFAGPWSAGTSVGLVLQAALDGQAVAPSSTFRGGMGALSQALASAAKSAGAEIRTGAGVARIRIEEERAVSVVLATGEEIRAAAVVSNADPRSTFLGLIDAADLDPDFVQRIRNYRSFGTVAKINYALSGLPDFARSGESALLAGRIHIGPEIDYLERAFDASKYGEFSAEPYLDITIPSLGDPSLAPPGGHVLSVHAQFAPYRLRSGDWSTRREEMAAAAEKKLAEYAFNFKGLILTRQVITPADLETIYGLAGGHIHHGEQALDQIFTMRPLLGWAQYRTPIRGLYLCGAGTHPGGGITGLPGANAAREILKDLKR